MVNVLNKQIFQTSVYDRQPIRRKLASSERIEFTVNVFLTVESCIIDRTMELGMSITGPL